MMPSFKSLVSAVLLLSNTAAANFWVSPQGSDKAIGSKAAPFKTLGQAQLAVRQANANLKKDLYVHVAAGTYYLDEPLNFTTVDSGSNGHRVIWQAEGDKVNISGGVRIRRWKKYDKANGIWSASTPKGLESRHFYANQQHAQRARQPLTRSWLRNSTGGLQVANDNAKFLLTTPDIEYGEIRGIGSFTDRYVPIDSVGDNDTLIMAQPAFQNNIIGYDSLIAPFADEGFFVENVLAFLDEENEYYLNSTTGTIYFKPPTGVSPMDMYLVLAKLEQLIVISGTYGSPVQDITFAGFNYMHTTWNYPSTGVGYADQQTGGYIGLNHSYPADLFESSRPFWWQVPGSIQVSASTGITFTNGSMLAIMGGFGVGNDPNAHVSGVGYGAKNIEISGMYFTQTGTNTITMGGIQADGHHPTNPAMINQDNLITENIITDTGITYTSAAGLLVPYNNGTEISRNDLSDLPYSGIAYGYGWGANDAGGSPVYFYRGLYNYQPEYKTPTTQANGRILNNLVNGFGLKHTDLGGIYTLSASPNTNLTGNVVFGGANTKSGTAYHHDEGSRFYVDSDSIVNVTGNTYGTTNDGWWQPNETTNQTTGNLTAFNIAVAPPLPLEVGRNIHGDHVFNISRYHSLNKLTPFYQNVLYEAGIPPSQRASRPVSFNPPPPQS